MKILFGKTQLYFTNREITRLQEEYTNLKVRISSSSVRVMLPYISLHICRGWCHLLLLVYIICQHFLKPVNITPYSLGINSPYLYIII